MNNINILLAEDELSIRNIIKKYLALEGYTVFEAGDGMEAYEIFENYVIDLCILDIMMPKMDGYELLTKIRKSSNVPTIILTARGLEEDKIKGFNAGTDDYMTKPFSAKELVLRVKALLKRSRYEVDEQIDLGDLAINTLSMKVSLKGVQIELTKKEFDCLLYFANNVGTALSRQQLITKVWGYDFDGDDRTVDTVVKRLRKKLGDYGKKIVSVRGYGYRLES